jgi:hypothetical protein
MANPSISSEEVRPGDSTGLKSHASDDMIDTSSDFKRWPFLQKVPRGCRDELIDTYKDADKGADTAQKEHRRVVRRAAFSATAAVCVAIAELGLESWGFKDPWTSVAMTVVEAVLVGSALWYFRRGKHFRYEWLTQRNKAERCRLLKFSLMFQPSLWEADDSSVQDYGSGLEKKMESIKTSDLEKWLNEDEVPAPPGRFHPLDPNGLAGLREYYLHKRLRYQSKHFAKRSDRKESKRDKWWRELPGRLFWISVVCVAIHVLLSISIVIARGMSGEGPDFKGARYIDGLVILLAVLAAVAPTLGAGIHSWRSAWEGTRNISRFRAKRVALENIESRLERGGAIDSDQAAEDLLRDIWCAEQIMESEHREWLRLMKDAEWAG